MKIPGRIQSYVSELEGLRSNEKAKLKSYLVDMADSLPEHPSPKEVIKIVNGALKALKISIGSEESKSSDDNGEKIEKADKVKESVALTFKQFLTEGPFQCSLTVNVANVEEFKKIRNDMKLAGVPQLDWADTTRLFSDNRSAVSAVEKYFKKMKIQYTKELE